MIQVIQQTLSRRSQLAALIVMAALVAAAFAALSNTSAQTPPAGTVDPDEVTLGVHVYFPEDTDGVFVAKRGTNDGVDRVPVAIELRVTVPHTGDADDAPAITFGPVVTTVTGEGADAVTTKRVDAFADDGFATMFPLIAEDDDIGYGILAGITNGADGTQASGSRISLSGGNKFDNPSVATLYFDNSELANNAVRTESNPAVVLDCADDLPLREGNRPRVDQNADGKKTTTASCYVVLGSGAVDLAATDDAGRYAKTMNPEVFIAGVPDRTNITINALLKLGELGVSWGDGAANRKLFPATTRSGSATLRINNGENEVTNAGLSLAINTAEGVPCSGAVGAECPNQISTSQGSGLKETELTLNVSNSEGNASNWNGIRTIEIQTSRGDIRSSYGGSALGANQPVVTNSKVNRNCFGTRICQWTNLNMQGDPWGTNISAGRINKIVLKAAGTETGTASVTARVQAINGTWIETDAVEIRIAGPATGFTVAEAASNVFWATTDDNRDRLTLVPSATDASGESVRVDTLHPTFVVTGPDNRRVASSPNFVLDATRGASAATDDDDATGFALVVNAANTATARLKPGTYSVELRLDGTTLKDKIEFTVVGPANGDNTTLTADPPMPAGVRTPVTLTATVNDAEGNPVADGTNVTFSIRPAGGGTAAALLDTTPTANAKTKGGVATRTTIVVGSGLTVVTATADSIVETLLINVGGPSQTAEVRDITGLSSLNGFSNWRPANTVTAGELYRGLQARGVGLLWKYNSDGSWLRFGLAGDGTTPLPGSDPDFEIAQGDTLFIGGRN